MATEAQVAANRANAQKSTGPRTPEGKAVVSQNAVKHGLLAREGVLRGEDGEEFQSHREMLLEELRPAGALEVILAARIIDLTWRLHRAAQDQDETFGALYDRHTAGVSKPADPAERGVILGRMILEDYSGEAVLERLLRTERRIEGSLFRNLNELRRVHDQGRKADLEAANTLERWREEDDQARKARAFAFPCPADRLSRPDGTASSPRTPIRGTNTLRFDVPEPWDIPSWPDAGPAADPPEGDETCETNPICAAPRSTGVLSVNADHGRDGDPKRDLSRLGTHAHATGRPDGIPAIGAEAQGQLCETNPICAEVDSSQVQCGTAVRSDTAPNGLRKTKPIPEEVSGWECQVSSEQGRAAAPLGLPTSDFPLETAAEPPCGTKPICPGTGRVSGEESVGQALSHTEKVGRGHPTYEESLSCETKPISPGAHGGQVLYGTEVMANSVPDGLGENKANCRQQGACEAVARSTGEPIPPQLGWSDAGV